MSRRRPRRKGRGRRFADLRVRAASRRRPRRGRWLLTAVVLAVAVWQLAPYWRSDAGVRRAVDALYASSVYADPAEPGVVDVARARQVVGDRPVVVAVLPAGGDALDRCGDVVATHDDVVAVVFTGAQGSAVCTGGGFPEPRTADLTTDLWVYRVITDAEYSAQFRVDRRARDRMPQVEELVLAFDAAVPAHYPQGVPRREFAASPRAAWEAALRLAAVLALLVAGFALLRVFALQAQSWWGSRRALRARRLAQLDRVGLLADAVIAEPLATDPATARRRAEAAGAYVLLLGEVERARGGDELDAVDARLVELEARWVPADRR